MTNLDRTRAEISAIIGDLEKIPPDVRAAFRQPEDAEAYEIVRRIQRRLQGLKVEAPPQPPEPPIIKKRHR